MRDLTPAWRWLPATTLALILLLLLAAGAARLYPRGDLGPPPDPFRHARPLQVLPDVAVIPAAPAPAEDTVPPPAPPPPPTDAFRDLWSGWIAERALEIVPDDDVAPPPSPPDLPPLDWRRLAAAEPDTTVLGLLARTMLLRHAVWEDHKIWAVMDMYGRRAARYQAMKASVFNEDWLGKEDLD